MSRLVRAAAMDLGSNTLRLLVADVEDGQWRAVERGLASPRIGRSLGGDDGEPRLDHAAKLQAIEDARRFCTIARDLGAERIALAATQACRRAADGEQFVADLGQDLGLDRARIISGAEEAALSRLGVMSRLTGPVEGALLADVGGGSTELTPLDGEAGPTGAVSLMIGAVSLTERYLASDPPTADELGAMEGAVDEALAGYGHTASRLVATAGSAATLASMVLGLKTYQPDEINNLPVSREVLDRQYRRLAAMNLATRRQAPGLEPERADIILAGLAIMRGLMTRMKIDNLTTMDAGLLEGILLDDLAGWQYLG